MSLRHHLAVPVKARFIKFRPSSLSIRPCMRVEVYKYNAGAKDLSVSGYLEIKKRNSTSVFRVLGNKSRIMN